MKKWLLNYKVLLFLISFGIYVFYMVMEVGNCFMRESNSIRCALENIWFGTPILLVIYANWFWLIPKFLAKKEYLKYFLILFGVVLVAATLLFSHYSFTGSSVLESNGDVLFRFTPFIEAFGMIGSILLFTTPIVLSFSWFEQQNKINNLQNEQLQTELAMLKNQINPHFFFNTLNNLYALTKENTNAARKVILKLSDVMRYTIYEGQKERVPLQEEVDMIESFIELQKIRLHKKVDITFEKDIHSEKIQVPPLLFIIFIENAFKHGVDSLTGNAFVNVMLKTDSKHILFSVQNNFDLEENNKDKGIGLQNVQRRLELLFPQKHDLIIETNNNIFKIELKIKN